MRELVHDLSQYDVVYEQQSRGWQDGTPLGNRSLATVTLVKRLMNSIQVQQLNNAPRHRPPRAHVMEDFHRPELRELRERYRLDEMVAAARNRFDALICLKNWLGGLNKFGGAPERVKIHHRTEGSGPPFICVHRGKGNSGDYFLPFVDQSKLFVQTVRNFHERMNHGKGVGS